ncbi:unnamed protein product [Urochloa humidicola]
MVGPCRKRPRPREGQRTRVLLDPEAVKEDENAWQAPNPHFFEKPWPYHYGAPPCLTAASSASARARARALKAEFAANPPRVLRPATRAEEDVPSRGGAAEEAIPASPSAAAASNASQVVVGLQESRKKRARDEEAPRRSRMLGAPAWDSCAAPASSSGLKTGHGADGLPAAPAPNGSGGAVQEASTTALNSWPGAAPSTAARRGAHAEATPRPWISWSSAPPSTPASRRARARTPAAALAPAQASASASNGTTQAAHRGATVCRSNPAAAPPFWSPSYGPPDMGSPSRGAQSPKSAACSSGEVDPAAAPRASDPAGSRSLPGTTVWENVWSHPRSNFRSFFR